MSRNGAALVFVSILFLLLVSCTQEPGVGLVLEQRLLLWHDWQGPEAGLLQDLLDFYSDENPNVEIIIVPVPEDDLVDRYLDNTSSGVGPDIVLADSWRIYNILQNAPAADVRHIMETNDLRFQTASLEPFADGDRLHALPFSMNTLVLFFNKGLVDEAPRDLAGLEEAVIEGKGVAINTNFVDSSWGIGAFAGSILNEDGELSLAEGGFVNWVDYLRGSRSRPGVIAHADSEELRRAFIDGDVAFYVGRSSEYPLLLEGLRQKVTQQQEALLGEPEAQAEERNGADPGSQTPAAAGITHVEDILGVSDLPFGPLKRPSSPQLYVDGLMLNPDSSAAEKKESALLATFLTNRQQQERIAGYSTGRVPANAQIRLTPGHPDITQVTARQIRTARSVSYDLFPLWSEMAEESSRFSEQYRSVLEGLITPLRFVEEAAAHLSNVTGIPVAQIDPADLCPDTREGSPRRITIWHAADSAETAFLQTLTEEFEATCADVHLDLVRLSADEIIELYTSAAETGDAPDALLESSRWTLQLVDLDLLRDLSEDVHTTDLQSLIPEAAEAMLLNGRRYGIPSSVSVLAQIVNKKQTGSAPLSIYEIPADVDLDRRWILPVGFFDAYWGLEPFGGFQFNGETGVIENSDGLEPWLEWIDEMQPRQGFDISFDPSEAVDRFALGEAAYLVSGPWALDRLEDALGKENFSVVTLPLGPQGLGSPILQVNGLMVSAGASEEAAETAVAFARFINLPGSQTLLLRQTGHVPATVNVSLDDFPHQEGFREQAKVASIVTENTIFARIEELGDELYEAVLIDGQDSGTAVAEFLNRVEELADERGGG